MIVFDVVYKPKPNDPKAKVIHHGLSVSSFGVEAGHLNNYLHEQIAEAVKSVLNYGTAPKLPPEGSTITITRRRL